MTAVPASGSLLSTRTSRAGVDIALVTAVLDSRVPVPGTQLALYKDLPQTSEEAGVTGGGRRAGALLCPESAAPSGLIKVE